LIYCERGKELLEKIKCLLILFFVCVITIPINLCYAQNSSTGMISFSGQKRIFQSPVLDILGYKIYITGELSYSQQVTLESTIEKSQIKTGDVITVKCSMNSYEPQLSLLLKFHFGEKSYVYEYSFPKVPVPGQTSLASIPIPIVEILTALVGVPLPISLYLDFDLTSYFKAELSKIGFIGAPDVLKWMEKGTKSLFFDFNGDESGVSQVKIAYSNVVHEVSGKFVISIPLIGTYTLYAFPIQTLYFSSSKEIDVITFYHLNVVSDYGVTSGSGWFYKGTSATFKVEPLILMSGENIRHVFVEWKGEGSFAYSGPSNIASVVMDGPITEATEWKKQFKLTVVVEGHGTTSPAPQEYWEDANTTVSLTAIPEEGYQLEQWLIDGMINNNKTVQVLMDASHVMKAVFTQIPTIWAPLYGVPAYLYLLAVILGLGATLTYFFIRRKKIKKQTILSDSENMSLFGHEANLA
jgi:hypothetical protein